MPRNKSTEAVSSEEATGVAITNPVLASTIAAATAKAAQKAKKKDKTENKNPLMLLRDAAIKQFGNGAVKTWEEFYNCVYGVPIYRNLPLQYLFGVDVMPLGRSMSVVGSWGTSKSSFCWYLATLFARMSGLVPFVDGEFKSNPNQICSILKSKLNIDPANYFQYMEAPSLDRLLDAMIFCCAQAKAMGGKDLGIPWLLIVDSIGTVTSDKVNENVNENGEAGGFSAAKNAAQIKEKMQVFGPGIANIPMLALLVNHQKEKLATEGSAGRKSFGPPPTTEGGGTHKDFMYTWTLQLKKGIKEKTAVGGVIPHILFSMKKSSLSRERPHPIEVPYRSIRSADLVNGFDEQIWYDWDHALTLMLTDDKQLAKSLVKEVIDIKADGKKYSCKQLGLIDVSATELGAAIHSNDELVAALQDRVLEIRRKPSYGIYVEGADVVGGEVPASDEGTGEVSEGEEQE